MLELALRARFPMVKVETTDTVNALDVISRMVDRPVIFHETVSCGAITKAHTAGKFVVCHAIQESAETVYRHLLELEDMILLLNTECDSPVVFDAGDLPTPRSMIHEFLTNFVEEDSIDDMMQALGGLTLKDIAEVCQLTMAATGGLTQRGVTTIRRQYASKLTGIAQVDPDTEFYMPPYDLERWLYVNGEFFLHGEEPRLVPRGLLLQGEPGVGKTQGVKFLAWSLGVPLYRLDMSSMMTKWLGVSETSLRNALQQIDREEPCVLLIDEVEKLFQAEQGTDQTARRMLSQLLWWLQEHRTRVLSVMTTNRMDDIPPELYREGRVDEVIELRGLTRDSADVFVKDLLKSFGKKQKYSQSLLKDELDELYETSTEVAHAAVTQAVYSVIKMYGK